LNVRKCITNGNTEIVDRIIDTNHIFVEQKA